MLGALRRWLSRLGWLLAALLLAFGSAGIVTGVGGPPGTAARPELTWAGDEAIRPAHRAALDDLRSLSSDMDDLGLLGRAALAALVARDLDALSTVVSDGQTLVDSLDDRARELGGRLSDLPGLGPGAALRLSPDTRARQAALVAALDATDGLAVSWARLTAGSVAAVRLIGDLEDHDLAVAEAARLGRSAKYDEALAALDPADAALAGARSIRDQLANSIDVTVLDQWIERNAAYDAALRDLYEAFSTSQGRVTTAVKEASAAEQRARERLPPDTRGLVVIMAEIAQGGMNQAVIAIEGAKGRLATAVDALEGRGLPSAAR
jgi:hypothetical protein